MRPTRRRTPTGTAMALVVVQSLLLMGAWGLVCRQSGSTLLVVDAADRRSASRFAEGGINRALSWGITALRTATPPDPDGDPATPYECWVLVGGTAYGLRYDQQPEPDPDPDPDDSTWGVTAFPDPDTAGTDEMILDPDMPGFLDFP